MNVMIRYFLLTFIFILTSASQVTAKPLPDVPQAALDEMGVQFGIPRMSGFVFIDGRYIQPPYTVSRYGNGIFINRIQIEQPVPWSFFCPEDVPVDDIEVPAAVDEKKPDDMEDKAPLEKSAALKKDPEVVDSIDDLFGDDEDDARDKKNTGNIQRPKPGAISSIDDLFGDGGAGDEKTPAPVVEKSGKVDSLDDLFGDDEDDDAPGVRQKKQSVRQPVPVQRVQEKLSPAQLEERKTHLKNYLDEQRVFYERAIAKGELFFFGTMHNKVNGTYGSARVLFEVLPSALRYSGSPDDLLRRLQADDVYFLDLSICDALYRNRTTFPLLQQRLDKIRQEEALKEAGKKKY